MHRNAPFYGAFLFSVVRYAVLQADGNWGHLLGHPGKHQILERCMPMNDNAVKKIKPDTKAVKLSDGKGFCLLVNPMGLKL